MWESWIEAAAWRNETKVRSSRMVGKPEVTGQSAVVRHQFPISLSLSVRIEKLKRWVKTQGKHPYEERKKEELRSSFP